MGNCGAVALACRTERIGTRAVLKVSFVLKKELSNSHEMAEPALMDQASNVYNYLKTYTSMRTNIVIDDKLMRDTLRATGLKTKREVVEEGLRTLLRLKKQERIRRLRGKLQWQGDLNAMRSDS